MPLGERELVDRIDMLGEVPNMIFIIDYTHHCSSFVYDPSDDLPLFLLIR